MKIKKPLLTSVLTSVLTSLSTPLAKLLVVGLFLNSLIVNVSTASFIKPDSSYSKPVFSEPLLQNPEDIKQARNKTNDKTFNQELQWRILNLLAQQLFQNEQSLSNDIFSNNWLYTTQTFSVNISSLNPDFFLIKIIDRQQGEETQLEIPRM